MMTILFFRMMDIEIPVFQQDPRALPWLPSTAKEYAMPATPDIGQQLMGDLAPRLAELTDQVLFGDIWRRPQLSPRERSLVTVAALVALHRTEQLPFHLRRARDNGVDREQLAELITHLAFYAGWPCAASAITILRQLDGAATP